MYSGFPILSNESQPIWSDISLLCDSGDRSKTTTRNFLLRSFYGGRMGIPCFALSIEKLYYFLCFTNK